MQLLDPADIKNDKSETQEQAAARTRALAKEESRLTRLINLARENAQLEIEVIDNDYKEFKAEKEKERATLQDEVTTLRNQRAELLKPIDAIKKTAEDTLSAAELRTAEVERQEKIVAENREKNQETAEQLKDKEDSLDEREEGLDQREAGQEAENERLKASALSLGEKWVEYHKAVEELNKKILANKQAAERNELGAKANAIKQAELEENYKELEKDRVTIKSQYAALVRARIQIIGH